MNECSKKHRARLTRALLAAIALTACSREGAHNGEAGDPPPPTAAMPTIVATATASQPVMMRAPDPGEWLRINERVSARADTTDKHLRRVSNLTRAERAQLKADVNATQIARARQLGVRAVGDVTSLVNSGKLIKLPDTTDYWAVRRLDYSEPFVTPDAAAMLTEIGRRFHARLDSLGVPRYRLDITSVMRTSEKQAELRRRNSNASRIESAHEFGTTVDIAYRRFAAPDDTNASAAPEFAQVERLLGDSIMIDTGNRRSAELQAVLGRVLLQMRQEGKLMVMMERSQTVYHITVTRRFPKTARS